MHPFSLDENLDENLELFFGLSIPYLDFRIGVQGVDEAFSFIIGKDDKDKDPSEPLFEAENPSAVTSLHFEENLKLLKTARVQNILRHDRLKVESPPHNKITFLNSEYWKASSYMNSVMSSFFLSTLVSIVEYAQADITTLLQDWLNVVQYITSLSAQKGSKDGNSGEKAHPLVSGIRSRLAALEVSVKPLSVSVISQLMLRKDHSLSSCARDVMIKPLLSSGASIEHIKNEIDQWQDLIMDTYIKLKEDSSSRNGEVPTGR